MADQKNLPLPEKELPPPHDMLLNPESKKDEGVLSTKSKTEGESNPAKRTEQPHMPTLWEKYGSKKWLVPLLVTLGVLILLVSLFAFMGSRDDTGDRRENRKERREKRKDKRERRKNNDRPNKNNRKNKDKRRAFANADAGQTSFSYGSGANAFSMQYPGDMEVDINSGLGGIDGKTQVTVISFAGERVIKMTLVPNPNGLSLAAWRDRLAQQNKLYTGATETLTVGGKQVVLQNTTTPAWNAFIPLANNILWATMSYSNNDQTAKEEFTQIIKTIKFGENPSIPNNSGSVSIQ